MAYATMKKLIINENNKYNAGLVSEEEYSLWKESTSNKLDVFLACGRITDKQYEDLIGMLI